MKKIRQKTWLKNLFYLLILFMLWEAVFRVNIFPALLFPAPGTVLTALVREIADGSMLIKTGSSLYMVLAGLLLSLALILPLTLFTIISQTARRFIGTLISVLDPLPGIALLPLAILWFGIGQEAILFIMIHSILWPILLNVMAGFDTVPMIYQEIGMGFGLSRLKMVTGIYIPAAFPSILAGLKTGWARAWRALISAEMVFGATGASSGLGWDIYLKRSFLDMPGMFASLIVIMLVGILIENLFFKRVEKATIVKWGMVR